jgi:hypothetical protein
VPDGISPTDPQDVRPATKGALQSAIAILRSGLRPDGTYEGIHEGDTAVEQWRLLEAWARSEGLVSSTRPTSDALLGEYEARAYFRGRVGVFDVRPLNCVRTDTGAAVPIDVIPRLYGREASNTLRGMAS